MSADDPRWFETLYQGSYLRLTLIVLAHSRGNVADAEEIVQEAFAKAYAKRETLQRTTNPEAWVCTVALNIARRRWRRANMADRLLRRDRPTSPLDTEVEAANVDLYLAIRALPDAQREAVFLHHLAGLTIDEIADRTGTPAGTVKSRLARGRAALADQLGQSENQGASGFAREAREGTSTP